MTDSRFSLLLSASLLFGCSGSVGSDGTVGPGFQPGGGEGANGNVSTAPGVQPGSSGSTPGVTPPASAAPGEAVPPDGSQAATGDFSAAAFDLRGEPIYSRAIQLTNAQWTRTVQDILRLPEPPSQSQSFLNPAGGFTLFPNNERVLEVSNSLRDSYQAAAAEIASELAATPNGIERIGAGTDADSFIRTLGRRAFRRPLTDDEFSRYRAAFDVGAGLSGDGSEFVKGASLVIEALLQSPHFIYRTELEPTGAALTSYEVAAKLSFWILNTAPTDELLDRAGRGELDTPEGTATVATEMLDDPAASEMAVDMFAEMFKFIRYRTIVKSVPEYTEAMGLEAEQVSRQFFQRIYEEGQGLREILTSTEGFVGPELASLYGVNAPALGAPVDFGPERVGFFSQAPYLMLFGNDAKSDAIHRGLFINYQVLCAQLPEPNFALPEPEPAKPGQTDREYIEDLTGFGTCGQACHGAYINPLGYAFENFDGMGRHRDEDQGKPVDAQAAYPFSSGMLSFAGAGELMDILVSSTEAHSCFAKNIASYGLQRDIVSDDQALLDELATVSMSTQGSMKNLVLELVKAPAFRMRERGAL